MCISWRRILAATAALGVLAGISVCSRAFAAAPDNDALNKFAAIWTNLKTYTCTVKIHEANGTRVQDRVIHISFAKPHDTRLDIVAGDGRGGTVVWRGGDKVLGHPGGLFSSIKVNLGLRDPRVTTIRGETVAEANWGSVYEHILSLKGASIEAATQSDRTTIMVDVADPASNGGVTKEVLVVDATSLPIEYDQYEGNQQVKQVVNSDVKLDVDLPDSTWSI